MSNLHFTDRNPVEDKAQFIKGKVRIVSKQTGNTLFEEFVPIERNGDNKVIIPGSIQAAMKFFPDVVPPIMTPTYNNVMGLDGPMALTATEQRNTRICLFAMGTDGCGKENSQVIDVDYTKWIAPASLLPFRYVPSTGDISADMRTKYFGRKALGSNIAYYFKAFDAAPEMHVVYNNGTTIDENLYNTDNTTGGVVYVEMKMSIEAAELREYLKATTGLTGAVVNSISLLTAYPKEINGYTYYQDIRPMTKYNFSNIPISEEGLELDIIYDLYF